VGNQCLLVHNKCGDLGIFSKLKSSGAGKGFEIHHLIEKRFADLLGVNKNQMPSVVLDHSTHSAYTQMWRQLLPYGQGHTIEEVYAAARLIYANSPDYLEWAMRT